MTSFNAFIIVTDALSLDTRTRSLFDEACALFMRANDLFWTDHDEADFYHGLYQDTARRCLRSIQSFAGGVYGEPEEVLLKKVLIRQFDKAIGY